jgi:threonine/homoserine/homoserine lactone efflux protein
LIHYGVFVIATALLALTPGPNTALTISRTIAHGRVSGALVLFGVELGFLVHLFATAAGLTALLLALPLAYDFLRIVGSAYLLHIAYRMIIGHQRLILGRSIPRERRGRLIGLGFVSNAVNPKTAAFYVAIFPQFVDPRHGLVPLQILVLGATHIAVSTACNMLWVFGAGGLAVIMERHPAWERIQRGLFGTIIGVFAVRLLVERRQAPA